MIKMQQMLKAIIILNIVLLLYFVVTVFNDGFHIHGDEEESHTHNDQLEEGYHIHSDFIVYLDNEILDFSQSVFQSDSLFTRDKNLHLHNDDGEVIHIHKEERTLNDFLKSVDVSIVDECINTSFNDEDKSFCASDEKIINVFINGDEVEEKGDYVFNDLDRILIYYGDNDRAKIDMIIDMVSDRSCIFSLKCKERGTPPDEDSCGVGGCSI